MSTSDRREARRRAALLFVASDEAFELARDETLTPEELAAIARHWFEGQAALREKIDRLPPGQLAKFQAPDPVRPYRPTKYPMKAEEHQKAKAIQEYAQLFGVLSAAGYAPTPERIDSIRPALKKVVSDYIEARRRAVFHPEQIATLPSASVSPVVLAPLMSTLTEPFAEQAITEGRWTQQTRAQNMNSLDLLIRICGDKPAGSYTRADVEKFRRTLEKIPSNFGKSPKHSSMPLEQVIAAAKPGAKTLSVGTLDRHWNTVTAFIRWVNRLDGVPATDIDRICGGFRWSADAPEAEKRVPWDDESLRKLFSSPIWTGFTPQPDKPHRRYVPGNTIVRDHRFWLPILAIYSGARMEELAQLQRSDIQEIDGIHVMRLTDEGEGQKLKTDKSRRMVPIHSELVRLGFLEHVERIPVVESTARVFPEIERGGRDNSLSYFYTEEFTEYRRKISLYKALMDFHSFRHNVTTSLLRRKVSVLEVDQLTGHDSASRRDLQEEAQAKGAASVTLNYFAGFEVSALRDAIELLRWPSVDLSRHYVKQKVDSAKPHSKKRNLE